MTLDEAIKLVVQGFAKGHFVRSAGRDSQPYIQALAVLQKHATGDYPRPDEDGAL
jgi:hypothetical protein